MDVKRIICIEQKGKNKKKKQYYQFQKQTIFEVNKFDFQNQTSKKAKNKNEKQNEKFNNSHFCIQRKQHCVRLNIKQNKQNNQRKNVIEFSIIKK